MDRVIYTALGSISNLDFLRVQQSNDMANVSTVGYKRSGASTPISAALVGPGFNVRAQAVVPALVEEVNLTPGTAMDTGNPLDIYMMDSTVLGVQADDGALGFTRRGDLRVNSSGVLETGAGNIVMGDGGPITIPTGMVLNISRDGTIFAIDPQNIEAAPQPVGELLLKMLVKLHLSRERMVCTHQKTEATQVILQVGMSQLAYEVKCLKVVMSIPSK